MIFDEWMLKVVELSKLFTNCREIEIDYHKFNGKPSFFYVGKTFFAKIISKLSALGNDTNLNKLILTKVKCPAHFYKLFMSELKKIWWEATRHAGNTLAGKYRKNMSGTITISKLK